MVYFILERTVPQLLHSQLSRHLFIKLTLVRDLDVDLKSEMDSMVTIEANSMSTITCPSFLHSTTPQL